MGLTEEQKAIMFATAVPGALTVAGTAMWFNPNLKMQEFFKNSKLPNWAIKNDMVYFAIDTACTAAACYGAYKMYMKGGFDYSDTKLACCAYMGMYIVGGLPSFPALASKDWGKMFWSAAWMHTLSMYTMLLFFGIDRKAGLLMLPTCIWGHLGMQLCKDCAELNATPVKK